jgi:hypothetical protein
MDDFNHSTTAAMKWRSECRTDLYRHRFDGRSAGRCAHRVAATAVWPLHPEAVHAAALSTDAAAAPARLPRQRPMHAPAAAQGNAPALSAQSATHRLVRRRPARALPRLAPGSVRPCGRVPPRSGIVAGHRRARAAAPTPGDPAATGMRALCGARPLPLVQSAPRLSWTRSRSRSAEPLRVHRAIRTCAAIFTGLVSQRSSHYERTCTRTWTHEVSHAITPARHTAAGRR